MKERCCCLILNYNDSDNVQRMLNKIYSYDSFDKILVVDNCSTDDSYEKLQKYVNQKIIVIKTEYNGGYGFGNNFGIKYAKNKLQCKYVLLTNPDVYYDENLVASFLNIITIEGVAIVSAIQHDINDYPIKDLAWRIPTPIEYALLQTKIGNKFFDIRYKNVLEIEGVAEVDCVPGAMLMLDTKKFLEVGGYDENMFLYCEEETIAFKLKIKGYKTLLICNQYYRHEHSVSINKSITSKLKQMKLIFNNRIYFMKTYLQASCIEIAFAKFIHLWRLYKIKYELKK